MTEQRIDDILEYWFGHGPDNRKWFGGDDEVDRHIREHFARDVQAARDGELDGWTHSARGRLALVLLLDQFSRNIHRDVPECYSHDDVAQRLALEGVECGHDRQLAPLERAFLYMPLMHAEDLALQQRGVELFETLAAEAPEDVAQVCAGFADYARRHRDTVARFGRFPHRNAILGRESSDDELAFLERGGFFVGGD